jgi:hypothetical protein
MSQIGWVNFGRQEAEAVQALIGALTDSDARDELGLGTIRDGFSDLLFPGTSTVQTRLRYFVLLPGLFQKVVAKGGDAATALREVEAQLIEDFLAKPDLDLKGLIGSEAKGALKRMPSAVYWSGLGAWQIRLPEWRRATPVEVIEAMRQGRTCWAEFSGKAGDGFALSPDEHDWVIEKIAALASEQGGTLLGHLVQREKNNEHPAPDLRALPGAIDPGPRIAEQLSQALDFSQLTYGARTLYNLMLAEHFEHERLDDYKEAFRKWCREQITGPADIQERIAVLIERGPSIGFRFNPVTRVFLAEWLEFALGPKGGDEIERARALIKQREKSVKTEKRARLFMDPRAYKWSGSSGAGRFDYRWGRVRQYLQDLGQEA